MPHLDKPPYSYLYLTDKEAGLLAPTAGAMALAKTFNSIHMGSLFYMGL